MSNIKKIIPVGEAEYSQAVMRDGQTFFVANTFREKTEIAPAVFGKDGQYHPTTQKSFRVPSGMGVAIVGEVAIF